MLPVLAEDESAMSHCPLQTCLPHPVWPTGPAVSELAKSLTQAFRTSELQRLEVRRPHVRFFCRSRILWSSLSGLLLHRSRQEERVKMKSMCQIWECKCHIWKMLGDNSRRRRQIVNVLSQYALDRSRNSTTGNASNRINLAPLHA
jgi:hypothetical protein